MVISPVLFRRLAIDDSDTVHHDDATAVGTQTSEDGVVVLGQSHGDVFCEETPHHLCREVTQVDVLWKSVRGEWKNIQPSSLTSQSSIGRQSSVRFKLRHLGDYNSVPSTRSPCRRIGLFG